MSQPAAASQSSLSGTGPTGVAIVANPFSGALENRARVEELVATLRSQALEPQVMWGPHELQDAAAGPDFAANFRCVIAAGGDGTLNRVINQQREVPLALFPLGNENLFARQFGFDGNPQHLARAIAAGRTRRIDLGRAGGRYFSIVASAGFDGDVAHRLARWRQRETHLRRVNSLSYARPILASACSYSYPMMELEADGQCVRGALILVFNLPCYCSGLKLAPEATGDDGWLDWVAFERPGRWPLARYVVWSLLGRHRKLPDVRCGRARRLRLSSESAVPIEIDGEAAEFTPLDIEVVPAILPIVAS